jgi:hypothetical protein
MKIIGSRLFTEINRYLIFNQNNIFCENFKSFINLNIITKQIHNILKQKIFL